MTRRRPLLHSLAMLAGALLVAWWIAAINGRAPAGVEPARDDGVPATAGWTTPPEAGGAASRPHAADANPAAASANARIDQPPPGTLAVGFRAPPDQRAADIERLRTASDLAPLLDEFQRRAASGDADAAARMREIYAECRDTHTLLPAAVGPLESPAWGKFDRSLAAELELLCGYPSVEAALIDAYWPQGSIAALSVMRTNLVARLRADAGAGIFDPAAPGGG